MNEIGAMPLFDTPRIEREWLSEAVSGDLRNITLWADLMFREHGGRARITKILGSGIYERGRAADISPLSLPMVEYAAPGASFTYPQDICRRLNDLWRFGDGDLETATYSGDKITIQIPWRGYPASTKPLAAWRESGVIPGRVIVPQGPQSREQEERAARELRRLRQARYRGRMAVGAA